jgi:hypothetical protein
MADDHPLGPLQQFVGVWQTEGTMLPASGRGGEHFTAVDSYELVPGGYFLLHHWDARMPDGRTRGIEVMGRAAETNGFFLHSYDDVGNAGVMSASNEGGRWTFDGESMRFRGSFSEDGDLFSGTWEFRPDAAGSWQPWMTVRLRRQKSG